MTSKSIDVNVRLTLTPVGEPPENLSGKGTLILRDGKALLQFESYRIQIEPERVLVRSGYTLELDPKRETKLLYPTPYGELSMTLRVKHFEIAREMMGVDVLYALYTNDEMIHKIRMNLKMEEIK